MTGPGSAATGRIDTVLGAPAECRTGRSDGPGRRRPDRRQGARHHPKSPKARMAIQALMGPVPTLVQPLECRFFTVQLAGAGNSDFSLMFCGTFVELKVRKGQ